MDNQEQGSRTTYDQCFSGSNFASQYEDECPVNYSLKYSETEPCKATNKCDDSKSKFKDYSDYAETDLDQPTNFSLKYAEKSCDEENKNNAFSYFSTHKVKFKEYADYVETDLDQPTDFTLKYRESAEEEIKSGDFNYYVNEQKGSNNFGPRRSRPEESEDSSCERLPERYTSQNETPLMFSRSSSMNSLSSFVHITQSIPDDRSSVVSDFSRMTSGIISPSELPDSPTQTAPSSPKRHKHTTSFSAKSDFFTKQSVFEDDVATYKQEGTPMEVSRATSLSSLNLDNPIKSELVVKRNATTLQLPKEENRNCLMQSQSEYMKHQIAPEKAEQEKGKFELASVLEVDESLCSDCISVDIQINCRKPKPNYGRLVEEPQESSPQLPQSNGFPVKSNLRLRFHNENRKGYSGFEGSDDAIHTYHTEGTPANVSHAGSHSDLSALSIVSGNPFSGVDDASDSESLFPDISETAPTVKVESHKSNLKVFSGSTSVKMGMSGGLNRNVYVNDRTQLDYFRKHQLTAKDEMATFATENSPCNFSIRSSLNDLTVNLLDQPLSISRGGACEEPPSQMLSPLHNVSPQSPNSVVYEEIEDAEKSLEEQQNEFDSSVINQSNDAWDHPVSEKKKTQKNVEENELDCTKTEGIVSANFEFDSNQPLTPFEEALLEECIRLGMPAKKKQKQLQENKHFKLNEEDKPSEQRNREQVAFSKFNLNRSKHLNEKKFHSNVRSTGIEGQASRVGKFTSNALNADSFEFDASEPLTPFEEVLLEQCILLGMPPKRNIRQENEDQTSGKFLHEGTDNTVCGSAELITPLETALLEQCIRLGMPQKKGQRKDSSSFLDESPKAISSLTAHLSRLKLNSDIEKDKDASKKCENCGCGKKHNNRRRGSNCKKSKNRLDHIKAEICPG